MLTKDLSFDLILLIIKTFIEFRVKTRTHFNSLFYQKLAFKSIVENSFENLIFEF